MESHVKRHKHIKDLLGDNYCWFVVAICAGFAAASVGLCSNTDGIFYASVCQELSVGRGTIALYTTFGGLTMGLSVPYIVKLMNKVDISRLSLAGGLLASAAIALMSIATKPWMFYILGILRGIGCATVTTVPINVVIGNWIKKNRSVVFGLIVSFAGGVGALANLGVARIIEAIGYKNAYLICATAFALLTIPGSRFIRMSPSVLGLNAHGAKEAAEQNRLESDYGAIAQFRPKSLLFFCVLFVNFLLVSVMTFTSHLPSYAVTLGRTPLFGATLSSSALVGSVVAKACMGALCQKIGPNKSMFIMQSFNVTALLIFLLFKGNDKLLIVTAFMFGLGYGITNVNSSEILRMLYGHQQFGRAYSILALVGNFSNAAAVAAGGFVYDITGSYTVIIVIGLVFNALAFCTVMLSCRLYGKETGYSLTNPGKRLES